MKSLQLFLPCAAGVEDFLADEVHGLTGLVGRALMTERGGVRVQGDWAIALRLNLESRLAQRVLIELACESYGSEDDLYSLASNIPWERWFGAEQTFRIDTTARGSPLKSLNFATLRIKDAVADRFRRHGGGERPSVDMRRPRVRVHAHLTATHAQFYIDTSGEPLFKRGWRQSKGDAPLKETLAAAMLAASGWWQPATRQASPMPLYDPCCGSGTIVIEAAQIALGMPAGGQRRFGFEFLRPFVRDEWLAIRQQAIGQQRPAAEGQPRFFGSDVAHRMVDFAERNADRAGVGAALQLRGGDALQRLPPCDQPGVLLLNPPYGERIATAGVAGAGHRGGREAFQAWAEDGAPGEGDADAGDEFFERLSTHWKTHFGGWTAWVLTPDTKLPGKLRLKASRRVPLWNGPIECRLLRFDLQARRAAPQA